MRSTEAHEGCNPYSSNPVCDMDSTVDGTNESGNRKLAQCVPCTQPISM